MDTLVDMIADGPPSSREPATHQSYIYHGTLDHQETIRDVAFGELGILLS